MVTYDMMATPALVLDEVAVHAGGLPKRDEVERRVSSLL